MALQHQDRLGHEILQSTILVVDDSQMIVQLIIACLQKAGFHNLLFAEDGAAALEIAWRSSPDLVVLDVGMPKVDGLEVCRRLRAEPATRQLPILVQSHMDSARERVQVFEAGATDMIAKPINPPEMIARIRIHLENQVLIRKLGQSNARIAEELAAARTMQGLLLPSAETLRATAARHRCGIASYCEASSELGGDLWGLYSRDDSRLEFFLLDFSGHGVGAALNVFRLHSLIQHAQDGALFDPGGFLEDLNHALAGLLPSGQFATMLYGRIDRLSRRFSYASAGAPRPLLGTTNGDLVFCESAGLPLGITRGARYPTWEIPFTPGSVLFLYSDALIESPDQHGRALEETGLQRLLARHLERRSARSLLDGVLDAFLDRAVRPLPDDLTAVCFVDGAEDALSEPAGDPNRRSVS